MKSNATPSPSPSCASPCPSLALPKLQAGSALLRVVARRPRNPQPHVATVGLRVSGGWRLALSVVVLLAIDVRWYPASNLNSLWVTSD